jgi:hypothetical protein
MNDLMTSEREFLSLAGTWLACRWKVMGGELEDETFPGGLTWHLLGMLDQEREMELLVREQRQKQRPDGTQLPVRPFTFPNEGKAKLTRD